MVLPSYFQFRLEKSQVSITARGERFAEVVLKTEFSLLKLLIRETHDFPQLLFLFRELLQSRSRDAVDGPVVHRHGAERLVEVDAGLVPVETDPLQAAAAALCRL